MNYFSVCDGIGAAHAALVPLGYRCVGVSEIDKYCNRLIEEKYGYKNYGDLTQWRDFGPIRSDLFIGGTPCTSFSIIGKKRGVHDLCGRLTFDFVSFVCFHVPRWFVWENVPNVLSIDGGGVFRRILAQFSELGYGLAWRVLDAQFFGVPQRRRRVFLVGCFGDPIRAGEVLFESEPVQVSASVECKTQSDNSRTVADSHRNGSVSGTLTTLTKGVCSNKVGLLVVDGDRPRRLTPLECERLQGFPDHYTSGFSDYQRHKMLGNSMPVPVVRWIGERILVEEATQ